MIRIFVLVHGFAFFDCVYVPRTAYLTLKHLSQVSLRFHIDCDFRLSEYALRFKTTMLTIKLYF